LIGLATLLIVVSIMLRNHVGETDPLAESPGRAARHDPGEAARRAGGKKA
jgi:hypothetical protein